MEFSHYLIRFVRSCLIMIFALMEAHSGDYGMNSARGREGKSLNKMIDWNGNGRLECYKKNEVSEVFDVNAEFRIFALATACSSQNHVLQPTDVLYQPKTRTFNLKTSLQR